jgi:hypothetical protein
MGEYKFQRKRCIRLASALLFPFFFLASVSLPSAFAQQAELRRVPIRTLPTRIDGNSPSFWYNDKLNLFTSIGVPETISEATDQFGPWNSQIVQGSIRDHDPVWVESAWLDSDGILFAWYHHEPVGLCGDQSILTAPEIGAAVSFDGGKTLEDLGIILKSGEDIDCDAGNGFFGGGHGDFSVVPDRDHRYFYFFFSNYAGPLDEQGIAVGRMAYEDRFGPAGAVWKYRDGDWNEPGLGGRMTALYPANKSWKFPDADALWGPSVHWNTYLEKYVVLMNHACCEVNWMQEGIYVSYISDLADPTTLTQPMKLLDRESIGLGAGFYPQVLGLQPGETDSVSGWSARLYIQGTSKWEIMFSQ